MRGAPLIETCVCQYEQSADGNPVDTHPEYERLDRRRRGRARLEAQAAGPALGERKGH